MSQSSKLISAIVLNYRSPRDTVRCVRALQTQSIAEQIEILVVDNKSNDESIGFIRAQLGNDANVRIIEERNNMGYGRANNYAATFATGQYLLIVNPDNTLPSDGLEKMLSSLKNQLDAGIVGPALMHPDGSVRPSARPFPKPFDLFKKRLFPEHWQHEFDAKAEKLRSRDAVEVDWLVGACLLIKRDLFEEMKGFDERFFLFFEDMDLCRRIKQTGKKVIYLPSVQVQDRKTRLSGSSILSIFTRRTTRIHFVSACKYFMKWGISN
jgi:GT2 family glycosyltransferase